MILYDPALIANYLDYGIMLPIPPDRAKRVIDFLGNAHPVLNSAAALACIGQKGPALNRTDLERIHSKEYTAKLFGQGLEEALLKAFELIDDNGKPFRYEPDRAARPLSDLFQILMAQAGGSYLAAALALRGSDPADDTPTSNAPNKLFCYYLGGGMHHARYDAGSGFCLINDVAAAAFKILAESASSQKPVRVIWIVDVDAHKGDGTAELIHFARERGELRTPCRKTGSAEEKIAALQEKLDVLLENTAFEKPCILTLSIHMAKGWPLDKESLAAAKAGRAPLLPSDVDIGIDAGEETAYTARLAEGIEKLESLSVETMGTGPDLIVVVNGSDPYEHDGLPSSNLLRLTLEQCVERSTYVYRYCLDRNIPSAWIQSGGYGDRAWEPEAHFLRSIG